MSIASSCAHAAKEAWEAEFERDARETYMARMGLNRSRAERLERARAAGHGGPIRRDA